ncbi:MAG: Ig-like domain-containing protein [Bacteroidia bacterium]|nr:Ig-like domain-containing protein [Bacteroidia bacterium]
MLNKLLSFFSVLFLIILMLSIVHSCANMAAPTGGRYDETPPRLIRSTPTGSALNVNRKIIEIEFDENIKIEKPTEKVIITPPQLAMPVIRTVGKKAIVELEDNLLPNTTYTIDFTDAIVDNNEGNPLENFSISFSTGDQLDTLAVSGKVLTASNLEPAQGIYVGMHSNMDDTAFVKTAFERISRTDSRGRFTVKGLAPGKYKIFALDDKNRNYKYDTPQEAIAFLDSIVIPSSIPAVRQDTVFKDSVTIDTIKTVNYTRFLPDNVLLRSFSSGFQRKYFQKHERPDRKRLNILFAAPTEEPTFELLKPTSDNENWFVMEKSKENDTISLWISDSLISIQDTLIMKMNYLKTDTLNQDLMQSDTLSFNFREPRQTRKEKKEEGEKEEIRLLAVNHNVKPTHEIYSPIQLEFEHPVIDFNSSKVRLTREVDSVFSPVNFTMTNDTLNPRKYVLRHKWEPGGKYKLAIDSATVHCIYGLWNNKIEQAFSVKALDQYGNIMFQLSGLPTGKTAYVELLDKSDKPFRKVRVKNNEALIFDINPGIIYARLFIDDNEDGEWTTGDYEKKRQPEMVYYYPRAYEIRAYTDHEESWNVTEVSLDKQKPLDITKNKPEEKKRRNLNEERQRQQQQNQPGSSPFSGGIGGMGGAGSSMQRQSNPTR